MMKKGVCSFEHFIIGLFRSTVLQVMSLTRFLCATMIFFDMCPAVAHMSHRLHCVQINITINHLMIFTIILWYMPQPRTYPSQTFVALPICHWAVSIHLLRLAFVQKCFHYTTMTRFDICPTFAHIRHRLHCVHLPICHCVVLIHILRHFVGWHASITLQWLLHHWMVSIHLLQPSSARFHYASMTRLPPPHTY